MTETTLTTPRMVPVTLEDDYGVDAIEVYNGSRIVLCATTVSRLKTSALSGSEWRTALKWKAWDWRTGTHHRRPLTLDTTTPHVSYAAAQLYPLIVRTSAALGETRVTKFRLLRKGAEIVSQACPTRPHRDLLSLAGHLHYLIACALETAYVDYRYDLCFQPGCDAPGTFLYRRLHAFYPDGLPQPADAGVVEYRRFCDAHSTRGDCGIDDCDSNYEPIASDHVGE